jgi:hypothetical protein
MFAALGTVMVREVICVPPGARVGLFGDREAEGELGPVGVTEAVRLTVPAKLLRLVRVRMVEESIVPLKTVTIPTDVVIA